MIGFYSHFAQHRGVQGGEMVFLAKRLGVKIAENFWAGLGALIDKRDWGIYALRQKQHILPTLQNEQYSS